ncbi:MAG: methyltransferase family protein [Ktedonobacteraceae bacterium]
MVYYPVLKILIVLLKLIEIAYRECIKIRCKRHASLRAQRSCRSLINQLAVVLIVVVLLVQLCGAALLSISANIFFLHASGLFLVALGVGINVLARRELSTNWAPGYQSQIKRDQGLTTTGIYSAIRHPIYLGHILFCVGAEITVQSYLAVIVFFIVFLWAYHQGKSEEAALLSHFGKLYEAYLKKTKMLVPFVL